MDKVFAVRNGHARKIFERAVDDVIVVTDPADAGVGIKTGDDRIVKCHVALPHTASNLKKKQ
jgi:hypothetical protein